MQELIGILEAVITGRGTPWVKAEDFKRCTEQFAKRRRLNVDDAVLRQMVEKKQIVYCDGHFTLPRIALAENIIANNVVRILSVLPQYVAESVIQKRIDEYEQKNGIKLDPMQRAAVVIAVKNNFCIITGGPGTGKTSVIKAITYVLKDLFPGKTIGFAAPTGKAAKRINESTGEEARTFNSMLCIGVDTYSPTTISYDTMFGDEFSMCDLFLSGALFASVQTGHRLVISGDVDQLASVGPGCVLNDLIESGVVPTVMLTKTFRQDNSSVLFENIQRIRTGRHDLLEGPDFRLIRADGADPMRQLMECYKETVCEAGGVYQTGCLIPFRRQGTLCTNAFNNAAQTRFNRSAGIVLGGMTYKVNSPVIQLVNRNEVSNGEIGRVAAAEKGTVTVRYGSTEVAYTESDAYQISLAYAISIHKSQGSEYPAALVAITREHRSMLNRNILYTGITRAKKKAVLFYDPEALEQAVTTDGGKTRLSMLARKLAYATEKYQLIKKSA